MIDGTFGDCNSGVNSSSNNNSGSIGGGGINLDSQLCESFRTAANAVAQLYTQSQANSRKAYESGYYQCLLDFTQLIASSSGNSNVVSVVDATKVAELLREFLSSKFQYYQSQQSQSQQIQCQHNQSQQSQNQQSQSQQIQCQHNQSQQSQSQNPLYNENVQNNSSYQSCERSSNNNNNFFVTSSSSSSSLSSSSSSTMASNLASSSFVNVKSDVLNHHSHQQQQHQNGENINSSKFIPEPKAKRSKHQ